MNRRNSDWQDNDEGLKDDLGTPDHLAETHGLLHGLSEAVLSIARGPFTWRKLIAPVLTIGLVLLVLGLSGVLTPGGPADQEPSPSPSPSIDSSSQPHVMGSLTPTNTWVNFYGVSCSISDEPLPAGTVLTARDEQGVVCGEFLVTSDGRYGLMPVYGDDPATEADEGAEPGDSIDLYVDSIRLTLAGPDRPVWTEMGDLRHIEFSAP